MTRIAINEGFVMEVKESGQGTPIMLLHGYCGSSDYWKKTAAHLSKHYRVIMPDLRGHGRSDAPVGAYTIEQMADDIVQLADKLELERFVLLGHSMGGYVALSVLERYSDRLLGAGLIHSTAFPDSEEAKVNRLKAVERIQKNGISEFVDGLVPKLFHPDYKDQEAELILEAKEIGYLTPPHGAIGAALAMREREDRTMVLSAAKLPILLTAGQGDSVVPQEKLFIVNGPHVMQAIMEQAGHMGMMEQPEELADIINRFMKDYAIDR